MQIDPNDLMIYAAVVEAGSFTQAAKRLRPAKVSVSRRVAVSEGARRRLLTRTTRSLTITLGQGLLAMHAGSARSMRCARSPSTMPNERHAQVSMLADFSTRCWRRC